MLILFLLTFCLKNILKFALTHFENTERVKRLQKIKCEKLLSLLQNSPILFLMEYFSSKLMEGLWVYL